jgi:hypothetical protein
MLRAVKDSLVVSLEGEVGKMRRKESDSQSYHDATVFA